MKGNILVLLAVILLASCNKKNDRSYPENPQWLDDRISQMATAFDYVGTVVSAYEWNKEYYYLISIPISSCGMCEFYNYEGKKVEWTQDRIDDFQNNAKKVKIVWERKLI